MRSGAMNSLTKAAELAAEARHEAATLAGRSCNAMPSFSATTWATRARKTFFQVRAAKNPARCAASCTLSEKAMTFGSSL